MRRLALLGLLVLAGCGGTQAVAGAPAVRKLDDHPLFEYTSTAPTPSLYAKLQARDWACTVFLAAGGDPVLGRNFDFHHQPALVLHHRPPGAYKSVSLVDISYLGVDHAHVDRVDDPGALKDAARIPFDGMNEKGVAVAMAAVPAARSAAGKAVGSLSVMRQVLDRAASVEEAVAIFRTAAVDFSGGPPLHYLVADASGAGAVVEYVDGAVQVIPRANEPYLAMTNFTLTGDAPPDRRYRTTTAALDRAKGDLTTTAALDLLHRTRQGHTRWSAAYDLRARRVHVRMRGGRVLTFSP